MVGDGFVCYFYYVDIGWLRLDFWFYFWLWGCCFWYGCGVYYVSCGKFRFVFIVGWVWFYLYLIIGCLNELRKYNVNVIYIGNL